MKLAIVGSRNLSNIDIEKYISNKVKEIISGGAIGVDACAKEYVDKHGLQFSEIVP